MPTARRLVVCPRRGVEVTEDRAAARVKKRFGSFCSRLTSALTRMPRLCRQLSHRSAPPRTARRDVTPPRRCDTLGKLTFFPLFPWDDSLIGWRIDKFSRAQCTTMGRGTPLQPRLESPQARPRVFVRENTLATTDNVAPRGKRYCYPPRVGSKGNKTA